MSSLVGWILVSPTLLPTPAPNLIFQRSPTSPCAPPFPPVHIFPPALPPSQDDQAPHVRPPNTSLQTIEPFQSPPNPAIVKLDLLSSGHKLLRYEAIPSHAFVVHG